VTHPAQHHVDASKKRQRAWVEGRARGGKSDRPGKAGALKGGASEDRETQSDTRALVPHLRDARFPPPDTVAGAEEQKERARGGRLMRADGGGANHAEDEYPRLPMTDDGSKRDATPRYDQNKFIVDDPRMPKASGGEIERTPSGSVKTSARRKAETHGETMPGGKFPIRNASDLANAKHDVGRASDPAAARRWINRRAKELGEPPLGG
jgi:hypothetical protein